MAKIFNFRNIYQLINYCTYISRCTNQRLLTSNAEITRHNTHEVLRVYNDCIASLYNNTNYIPLLLVAKRGPIISVTLPLLKTIKVLQPYAKVSLRPEIKRTLRKYPLVAVIVTY